MEQRRQAVGRALFDAMMRWTTYWFLSFRLLLSEDLCEQGNTTSMVGVPREDRKRNRVSLSFSLYVGSFLNSIVASCQAVS
jgi:hypothetical protein